MPYFLVHIVVGSFIRLKRTFLSRAVIYVAMQ
jgi:hypothetical protein